MALVPMGATALATAMVDITTTARGLLMLSPLLTPRLSLGAYGGYGLGYGYGGYHYYGKRSADAEPTADAKAEPWYYGGYGWPYYGGYGYGLGHYYGKRSADAEPTADAKAEPWYY